MQNRSALRIVVVVRLYCKIFMFCPGQDRKRAFNHLLKTICCRITCYCIFFNWKYKK
jgi:hypothetical protein